MAEARYPAHGTTGADVRSARIAAGVSLRDLAKALETSPVALGELERGRDVVWPDTRWAKLAELLPVLCDREAAAELTRLRHTDAVESRRQLDDAIERALQLADEEDAEREFPTPNYAALGYPETELGYSNLDEVAWVVGFSTRGIHDYARRMAR